MIHKKMPDNLKKSKIDPKMLEKVFTITETSTVIISADAFNITNSAHVLKEEPSLTADEYGDPLRILNPRVIRFGIRFNF